MKLAPLALRHQALSLLERLPNLAPKLVSPDPEDFSSPEPSRVVQAAATF